jgi:hypothetical protein
MTTHIIDPFKKLYEEFDRQEAFVDGIDDVYLTPCRGLVRC